MQHSCNLCQVVFESNSRVRKFCSSSCAAKSNNKLKIRFSVCLFCNSKIKYKNKYCSNFCQGQQRTKKKIVLNIASEKTCKNYLLSKNGRVCEICKNHLWNNNPIPIELDHIDGNHKNNNLEN